MHVPRSLYTPAKAGEGEGTSPVALHVRQTARGYATKS